MLELADFRPRLPLREVAHVDALSALTDLTLLSVFDRPLVAAALQLYTPPSCRIPTLRQFEYQPGSFRGRKADRRVRDEEAVEAEQREKTSRSIFAHNTIPPSDIADDLKEVDEAIGDVRTVEQFVIQALRFIGVQVDARKEGYIIFATNLPQRLRELLSDKNDLQVSFHSPTPSGFKYIGRNHPFTEHLAQYVINNALQQTGDYRAARAAVLRTDNVTEKTVLFQLRVRNVIAEQRSNVEIVAEEMWLWGYNGSLNEQRFISKEEAMKMLHSIQPSTNMEIPEQCYWLEEEMEWINNEIEFRKHTDNLALKRADQLVYNHAKFRKLVSGNKYKVVVPVLPMDVLGVYILLPEIK